MSETVAGLRRLIERANDLQGVVRTMKAVAGASIVEFERATRAVAHYAETVERGLGAALRANRQACLDLARRDRAAPSRNTTGLVVFGSDQGLVGAFNDVVAEHVLTNHSAVSAASALWVVGERINDRLSDAGLKADAVFGVPPSVQAVTSLVTQILVASEEARAAGRFTSLHLYWCRPTTAASYEVTHTRLLPLDAHWVEQVAATRWPTSNLPETPGPQQQVLRGLIREHLFASMFRAAAESLAAEHASRLSAMQRADRNIEDLLTEFTAAYHRVRQDSIDAELFDVVAGFEATRGRRPR